MALTYSLTYETIKFTGGEISVRGINSIEIEQLVAEHGEAAIALFNELMAMEGDVDLSKLVLSILQRFRSLICHAVALAADVPDRYEEITKLPVDVLIEAVTKMAKLSFAMEGGAKKFFETVINLLPENSGLEEKAGQLMTMFTNGFGGSEPK